ncbi:MAG: IS66 family insertion sequence element accessory protein TnpA [Cellulosilyticaceae bacterium]
MTRKRRTDEEWMSLIQQCKSSGYSDTHWCRLNDIPVSTFYNKLSLLREKADLNEVTKPVLQQRQEVVEVHFQDEHSHTVQKVKPEVALCLNLNGIGIEIFNNASKATIENTLNALRVLC